MPDWASFLFTEIGFANNSSDGGSDNRSESGRFQAYFGGISPTCLGVAMSVVAIRRRHVQGRVSVEKAHRQKIESSVHYRHHRPVLGARNVVMAQGIPNYDVSIVNCSILLGPLRKSRAPRMLIGVWSGSAHLIGLEWSDPEVLSHESRPFRHSGLRVSEGEDIFARN